MTVKRRWKSAERGDAVVARVFPCSLPDGALLTIYAKDGGYTDCWAVEVPGVVTQAEFVEAFYTGTVFKLELFLLGLVFAKPSTNADARRLAAGELTAFSGWRVEAQSADELLMCDLGGGLTRSWLMAVPLTEATTPTTRLHFGSAVLARIDKTTGETRMSPLFAPLLGFHKFYSRVLLGGARARLAAASPVRA